MGRIDGVITLRPTKHEYIVRRATPLFAQADSRYSALGVLPAGTLVRGGLPSSKGWIPLEDDLWVCDDGTRMQRLKQMVQRFPFSRHVELPDDADIAHATLQEVEEGVVVSVPRRPKTAKRPAQHMPELVTSGAVASSAPTPDNTAPDQTPPKLGRTYSAGSLAVFDTLDSLDEKVFSLQGTVDQAWASLEATSSAEALDLSIRSRLGQVHGDANSMLTTKIDAILIGDLTSGKDFARARRKRLIQQVEALIEQTEEGARRFDDIRVAACRKAASDGAQSERETLIQRAESLIESVDESVEAAAQMLCKLHAAGQPSNGECDADSDSAESGSEDITMI